VYDVTDAWGDKVHIGDLTKDGIQYAVTLYAYKDKKDADAQFAINVKTMQEMSFSGSYKDAQTWTGTTSNHLITANALEITDETPPVVLTIGDD
jgi:uncharacterized protein YhjY with autotransporter beta-barrel domain